MSASHSRSEGLAISALNNRDVIGLTRDNNYSLDSTHSYNVAQSIQIR